MHSERYATGLNMLRQVDGKGGEAVLENLRDIAPDFARYLIEFPFGDIYARPGLDLKSREIAVVAALTALGIAVVAFLFSAITSRIAFGSSFKGN